MKKGREESLATFQPLPGTLEPTGFEEWVSLQATLDFNSQSREAERVMWTDRLQSFLLSRLTPQVPLWQGDQEEEVHLPPAHPCPAQPTRKAAA